MLYYYGVAPVLSKLKPASLHQTSRNTICVELRNLEEEAWWGPPCVLGKANPASENSAIPICPRGTGRSPSDVARHTTIYWYGKYMD